MASPTSALMAAALTKRLASRQPGAGGAGVSAPDEAGQQMSQQFSQLSGADPQMAMKTIQQMVSMLSAIYVRLIQQVPDAANEVAAMAKAGNKAVEKLQKAAATLNAVRPQIVNSANLPPGFQGQQPEMGGGGGEGM